MNKKANIYSVIFPCNKTVYISSIIISSSTTLSNMFLHHGEYVKYVDKIYIDNIHPNIFSQCVDLVNASDTNNIIDIIDTLNIDNIFDILIALDILKLEKIIIVVRKYIHNMFNNDTDYIRNRYNIVNDFDDKDKEIIDIELDWNPLH